MEELTVHCMVRNEPFVYYAVKSVYDYVGKILLYDTGSYDAHTLEDIDRLLSEDVDNKIVFKQVPIEVDETKWASGVNSKEMIATSKGKKGKWYAREIMIQDTESKFFIILDGDEVHYKSSMVSFQNCAKNWPEGKICGFVPLTWFYDMEHTFKAYGSSGRIFLTKEIGVTHDTLKEIHTCVSTGGKIKPSDGHSFHVPGMIPFAHFETFLKPWRRKIVCSTQFAGQLPEVMLNDMSFVERFLNERSN